MSNLSEYDDIYDRRVSAYERLGMTRSDAQGVVDAEEMRHGPFWIMDAPMPDTAVPEAPDELDEPAREYERLAGRWRVGAATPSEVARLRELSGPDSLLGDLLDEHE